MDRDAVSAPALEHLLRLTGKVAIVTGAARGIGRRIAERFSEAGAIVHCLDRASPAPDPAVDDLRWWTVDIADGERVEQVVAAIDQAHEGVDILVNAAGIFPLVPYADSDPALWSRVLATNVVGGATAARLVGAAMSRTGRGGSIINLSSVNATRPVRGLAHYAASKAAVEGLTRALALEFGPVGVRVNAIAPGGIDTPGYRAAAEQAHALTDDAAHYAARSRRPIERPGTVDDVAMAALYLASDMATYVTGVCLPVDGGSLLS